MGIMEVSTVTVSRFANVETFVDLCRILTNGTKWGSIYFFRIFFVPDKEIKERYDKLRTVDSFLFAGIENKETGETEYFLQKNDGTWHTDPVRVLRLLKFPSRGRTITSERERDEKVIRWFAKIVDML